MKTTKVFEVQGIGEIGVANLAGCITQSGKDWHDLDVGESCDVLIVRTGFPQDKLRLTRKPDRAAV